MILLRASKEILLMELISAQEIKRRGITAVDQGLKSGPVHVLKSNKASYVVMSEEDYKEFMKDLAEARLAASEADIKAGRVHKGDASKLMAKLLEND